MITFKRAFYIKLGEGGDHAAQCIADGTIWFGFEAWPHDLCVKGDWEALRTKSR